MIEKCRIKNSLGSVHNTVDHASTALMGLSTIINMIAPLIKELIAALAHEINNPLTPIMVLSEMDVATLPPPSESPKHLEIIHDAGERIQQVIQQLLSFNQVYHNGDDTMIELNRAVRMLINNIKKDFSQFSMNVKGGKGKTPLFIKINDAQFQQIVLFILYNIQSQMRSAGENASITFSTHEEKHVKSLHMHITDIDLPWFFPEDDRHIEGAGNSNFRDIQLILADLLAQLNHVSLTFGRNGDGTNEISIRFEECECDEEAGILAEEGKAS
jgi:hypothetical protein